MTPASQDGQVLIDRRTGVLTDVSRQHHDLALPRPWVGWGASVAAIHRVTDWRADGFGFGASAGNDLAARGAALGEAVERYCGNAVPADLEVATWAELSAAGRQAIEPDRWALYSEEQYATPGFPFRPLRRDSPVRWCAAHDVVDGSRTLVPASMVYLDTRSSRGVGEADHHSLCYAGIAAGRSAEEAALNGLREVIERDATSVWWASGASTRELDDAGRVTGCLELAPRRAPGRRADDLVVRLLEIPTDLPLPVVGALVEDTEEGLLAFGSACRPRPGEAALKALVEAVGLMQVTRQLTDPDAEVWRAVAAGHIGAQVYLPFRADRRYREAAGPGWRNLTDLPALAQLYLDPRMQDAPLRRLRPSVCVGIDDLEEGPVGLAETATALAHRGVRVLTVDLTTPDVAAAGLHVVRVLAPGLVGNAPAAFPLLGGQRLLDVPRRAGFDVVPPDRAALVTDPLPLA